MQKLKLILTSIILACFSILLILLCLLFDYSIVNEQYYKKFPLIEKENIKIVVASDLHFLSKTMTEEGSSVLKENYYGDGRIICYNEELIYAFIYQMKKERPDVILLTGDLTFDGSLQNHQELAKKLNELVLANIRVLVVPGNHDINNPSSYKYLAKKVEKADFLTSDRYKEIYYNFGIGNALSNDLVSHSYFYKISNNLGILMLDDNIYLEKNGNYFSYTSGKIKEETLLWLAQVLENNKDLDIIVGSHHNIYKHSTIFIDNYQINNHNALKEILKRYNVNLYLSGHMHIQHIEKEDDITEILTSALSITPHQYGIIEYNPYSMLTYDYYTKAVDVNAFAKINNLTDEKLLNFKEYSKTFYEESSYIKSYNQVMMNSVNVELAEALGRIMKLANVPYFAGNAYNIVDQIISSPDYEVIKKYYSSTYIDSIIEGSKEDYRTVKIYRKS